jgi:prolyl oligopeptidase
MLTETSIKSVTSEVIHGVEVPDPYRFLEDRETAETNRWISEQTTRFGNYFSVFGSLPYLRSRVSEFLDVETIDQIGKVGDRYFYLKRCAEKEQASIFVAASVRGPEKVLVDPAALGPYASVGICRISADASLLAYELKQGGEHSKAIYLIDVESGDLLTDHLDSGLARGFEFRSAKDGFYYCHDFTRDDGGQPGSHTVAFHRFGTPMREDIPLLTLPRTRSSKVLLLSDGGTLAASFYREIAGAPVVSFYLSAQSDDRVWKCILDNESGPLVPFLHRGRVFAQRFLGAPNGEIIELDVLAGRPLRVVIPESHTAIRQCLALQERFYACYITETESVVEIWSLAGDHIESVPLEKDCSWQFLPTYAQELEEFFLHCESFTRPPTLYCCRLGLTNLTVWAQRRAPAPRMSVATHKLSYLSKDGTEIAMTLVGPSDPSRLKGCPALMTAYGGFGLTMTPQFSTFVSILLELGFLFAVPAIRGGGERGAQWHEAARRRNRQVSIDDFTSAAEWLCKEGFTMPSKFAIMGGSHSGMVIGAAIMQRPDLFRAALCIAPLLDMVRYHLFDRAPIWAEEYGTADDADDFRALLSYSPYHNIREDTDYPAVLFVCGDKDTRCNPSHTRKMAARLQERSAQKQSVLVDYGLERGHAPVMPLSIRVDGIARRIAFLCRELSVPFSDGERYDTIGR